MKYITANSYKELEEKIEKAVKKLETSEPDLIIYTIDIREEKEYTASDDLDYQIIYTAKISFHY